MGGLHPQNISRMGFRQIFGGSTPPPYLTNGVPSNIWGVYTPKIFHGWGSVKYLGGLHTQSISRMGFRQIFGGSTPPKYFRDVIPSNIWGLYPPTIFDEWGSVKYLGGLHTQNISRMGFCQIFGGCTPPKYLTDVVPSNIWGLYTPKIFHGWGSVKYLGGLHPQNISRMGFCLILGGSTPPKIFRGYGSVKYFGAVDPQKISGMGFRQIFGGSTSPKYLTDAVPSHIWGLSSPKILHGWGSVKNLGGLHPQNISRMRFRQIFRGCTPPKYLTDGIPSNIWGVYSPQIFHGWGSVKNWGGLHRQNISPMSFRQNFGGTPKIFDGWGSVKYLGGLHPQNISRMGFCQIFGGYLGAVSVPPPRGQSQKPGMGNRSRK